MTLAVKNWHSAIVQFSQAFGGDFIKWVEWKRRIINDENSQRIMCAIRAYAVLNLNKAELVLFLRLQS